MACRGGAKRGAGDAGTLKVGRVREQKNPRPEPGRFDLCSHLFGGARRAVVLVRVGFGLRGGGAGGLGDAGNETLDQFDRAFHGAAGVSALAGASVDVGARALPSSGMP